MAIRFIFFDLGKVLINFDLDQMMRQVSDVTGADIDTITSAFFDDGYHLSPRAQADSDSALG